LPIDLQNSILDTKLARAELTPGFDDDRKILQQQINAAIRDQNLNKKLARESAKGSEIQINALLKVQEDERKIIGLKQQIKELKGSGGGFTLRELFQEAADEFTQFGSNIGGILSGQDARASFAKTVLDNLPKTLKAAIPKIDIGGVVKQGQGFRPARESGGLATPQQGGTPDPVLPIASAQLTQAQQQTAYLAQIAAAVSHGGPGKGKIPAPVTGNRGRVGSLEAIDAVQAASIWGYS
jgi:hypothetical protein